MKIIYSKVKEPIFTYTFLESKEEIAFFDIETTGLSANASSLYLIGLMYFDNTKKEWTLCQLFADNYQSEKEILTTFLSKLSDIRYLYHFNGKTFDIPYLLNKCKRHAVALTEHCKHLLNDTTGSCSIDLLGKIRSLRHTLLLDKCNQTAVEHWLDIQRDDTFSGRELITVYSEYMQQKILNPKNAEKLEKVLLLHNHDDVEMMLNLCSILTYDEYLSEACTKRLLTKENLSSLKIALLEQEISLSFRLPVAVPKRLLLTVPYPETSKETKNEIFSVEATDKTATLDFAKDVVHITFPIYQGTLKYFLPDYKDYYYLPKEDMAVHKSVAEFVDSAFRKKATAATGYIKKEGQFLPNLAPAPKRKSPAPQKTAANEMTLFYLQYKDSLTFCELPKDFADNIEFWQQFLAGQFPCFRLK